VGIKDILFSSAGETATKLATTTADLVERWKPGAEKRHSMDLETEGQAQTSTQAARQHDAPMQGSTWFDTLVNGLNRLIRPGATIYFLLALDGRYVQIKVDHLDPVVLQWVSLVLAFWFGGRTLLKDLPAAIAYLRRSGS